MRSRAITIRSALILAVLGALPSPAISRAAGQAAPDHRDVVYATVDGRDLALDLYLPPGVASPPLLVWVHGGAWRSGSKSNPPMVFVENGIATASLDFRQSADARFPAAVHDIKGAIRFLRAKAADYGYRSDRIVIAGSSSGGHLAALVGVTGGHPELEGTVGGNLDQSSTVQGIVDYFGASNLTTILDQSTPFGLGVREPALRLLLGAPPAEARSLAELASPVFHIDAADPPLLLIHGDQDRQMPINQAHELEGAYEKLGLDVYLEVVHDGGHGGSAFYSAERLDRALALIRRVTAR